MLVFFKTNLVVVVSRKLECFSRSLNNRIFVAKERERYADSFARFSQKDVSPKLQWSVSIPFSIPSFQHDVPTECVNELRPV